jgi:O-antigen/teichoic acid export membrane protein
MTNDSAVEPATLEPVRPSLRGKIFEGGAMLMGRQLVSMALSVVGLLVITRIIGPAAYGPYVAALGICQYAQNLGQAGIGVYLVRAQGEVTERTYDVATTLLLLSSGGLMLILEASLGLIARWVPMPGLTPLLAVMLVTVVLQTLTVAASARLERALDFRRVAMIETVGQLLYYGAALPLVLTGFGVWSLVMGWCLQQLFLCVGFHVAARYRPRLAWDTAIVRATLGYTLGYAASDWTWQLRGLVNPLIVGHFLPAEAVGQVGLAIRMMELLSFTKTVAYRRSRYWQRSSTSLRNWSKRRPTACACKPSPLAPCCSGSVGSAASSWRWSSVRGGNR